MSGTPEEPTGASTPTKAQGVAPPSLPEADGGKEVERPADGTHARYRAMRFHAKGGLGEVFVAQDDELHRQVALKRLQAVRAEDPESRRRFLLEAEITSRLEHPGIVPVYGLVQDAAGNPCYAMRFIQGETLQAAIERHHGAAAPSTLSKERPYGPESRGTPTEPDRPPLSRLALRHLLARFVHVCNTVAYAHSRGILHRDLKPTNIMLGQYGETLVMDWGLAKSLAEDTIAAPETATFARGETRLTPSSTPGDSPTQTGRAVGTPAFMSPEQAKGQWDKVGPASDIYGLGATLYAILTGRPPFLGRVPLDQVRRGEFPTPRQLSKETPKPLEAVCLKAMALFPADRYESAADLAADVERWLADEPVRAWREPWTVKVRRWIGRHRTLVWAGVSVVVVAALLLAWAAVQLSASWKREHAARIDADEGFRVARETVDRFYTEVSHDLLLGQPGMEELRKRLLADAKTHYERFVQLRGDDPALRAELARAYWRLGFITSETESKPEAAKLHQQAIRVVEQLVHGGSADADHQELLAMIHNDLGFLQIELKQHDEAERNLLESARIFRELADADPSRPAYQRGQATAHHNLGLAHRARGEPVDAMAAYEKALFLRRQLADKHPQTSLYRRELATTLNNLGALHRGERRPKEALKALEEALHIREQLAHAYPHVARHQAELAGTLNNLSLVHGDLRQPEFRIDLQQQAVAIWERLTLLHPQVSQYQNDLVGGLNTLGFLHDSRKQTEQAETAFRRALTVLEKLTRDRPDVPDYAWRLGGTLYNLGNHLKYAGKPQESLPLFDRSEQTLQELLKRPAPPERTRDSLRNTYMGRAEARALVGRFEEALADWDQCMKLSTERGRHQLRPYRAGTWARMGDYRRAALEARSLLADEKVADGMLYNCACLYALCAAAAARDAGLPTPQREKLTEEYARVAVELLLRLHKDGKLRLPALTQRMETDIDLDALRGRDDFKKLLRELGIPPKPSPEKPDEP